MASVVARTHKAGTTVVILLYSSLDTQQSIAAVVHCKLLPLTSRRANKRSNAWADRRPRGLIFIEARERACAIAFVPIVSLTGGGSVGADRASAQSHKQLYCSWLQQFASTGGSARNQDSSSSLSAIRRSMIAFEKVRYWACAAATFLKHTYTHTGCAFQLCHPI